MTRADDSDPTGKPAASTPFRFDSGTVRLRPAGAPTPAVAAAPEAPPAGTGPAPEQLPPDDDPDAAIAAQTARIRQRYERIGPAPHLKPRAPRWSDGAPWSSRRQVAVVAVVALACALATIAVYLAFAVPGPWISREAPRTFPASVLELTRGTGVQQDTELVVTAAGDGNLAIISVNTDLRADRYRGIAWIVANLPEAANVRVVWRSDTDPARTHTLPAVVEAGRVRPVLVAGAPGWVGNIKGLGLVVQATLAQPVQVRGVVASPLGAAAILAARAGEWFAFEAWSGTSINVVVGGADVQDLPLPLLIASVVALAACVLLALRRWHAQILPNVAVAIAALFFIGWFVLDARWAVNLARQLAFTSGVYGGKSERDKHLAAADGALYQFVERAHAVLPAAPQRVWVVSDEPFFSGRAAYHLYPHNVHFEPRGRAMPDRGWVKAGDWMLVYYRRGVEFDGQRNLLRWEGGPGIPAERKASGAGAALFLLQ